MKDIYAIRSSAWKEAGVGFKSTRHDPEQDVQKKFSMQVEQLEAVVSNQQMEMDRMVQEINSLKRIVELLVREKAIVESSSEDKNTSKTQLEAREDDLKQNLTLGGSEIVKSFLSLYKEILEDKCGKVVSDEVFLDPRGSEFHAIVKLSQRLSGSEDIEEIRKSFESYMRKIAESDWLMGKATNSTGWKATLGWIIRPENMKKIVLGKYDNNKYDNKPTNRKKNRPSSNLPSSFSESSSNQTKSSTASANSLADDTLFEIAKNMQKMGDDRSVDKIVKDLRGDGGVE